ncbi:MAG: helix-turn-helix domain-containing protein, partial [Nocardioides sp.]
MAGVAHDGEGALDRRHRVVLWALAISRPRAATVDRIADALWRGAPPATSDKVIQGSISRLRKAYGSDAIKTVDGGYRLSSSV